MPKLLQLISFLCHHAKTSSLIIVISLAMLSPQISKVNLATSYKSFVGVDSPMLEELLTLEDNFGAFNNVFIMLEPVDGNVFSPQFLAALIELTKISWNLPYAKRVDSLSNFQYTSVDGDNLLVDDFINEASAHNQVQLEQLKQIAIKHPEMIGYFINADASATGLNIDFDIDELELKKMLATWKVFTTQIEAFSQAHPNIELSFSGILSLNNNFTGAIELDIQLIVPLAFGLIFIGISALFLNPYCGIFALLISTLSSISALAFVAFMQWPVLPFTLSGVIIIMILSVADTTHIMSAASRNVQNGMDNTDAAIQAVVQNMRGLTLTTLTTAVGFLSFCYSDFDAIIAMGAYVAFGICIALVLSLVLLPPLLTLTNLGKRSNIIGSTPFNYLAKKTIQYRSVLLCLTVPTIIISGYLSLQNELDDSFSKTLGRAMPYSQDTENIEAKLSGGSFLSYNISSHSGKSITHPDFLRQVDAFAQWYKTQPEARFVRSYTKVLKRLNQNMHDGDAAYYALPEGQALAAQYLLLYELSLPYGMDLNNQINLEKTHILLNININERTMMEYKTLHERSTRWLKKNAPDLNTETSGSNFVLSEIMYLNFFEMLKSAIVALVIISLMLIIFFRSFYAGILCSIGVATPILVCFGAWAITNGVIGLAASYVISMAVGIAVDNSVHFMSKFLYGREQGYKKNEAIIYAMEQVGEAITINTIVLGLCFGTLIFSGFVLYSVMGLMTVITLGLALIAAFFLIPSLITLPNPRFFRT